MQRRDLMTIIKNEEEAQNEEEEEKFAQLRVFNSIRRVLFQQTFIL